MVRLATGAALALLAVAASAQSLHHSGTSSTARLEQSVSLSRIWADGRAEDWFSAAPKDVVTRVEHREGAAETITAHLLLFGSWGAFHYAFEEASVSTDGVHPAGVRTDWGALDVDGDSENEIVLVERRAVTRLLLDEYGEPLPEPGPVFEALDVTVRYLDRFDGSLREVELPLDLDSDPFKSLAALPVSDAVRMALTQGAADQDFASHRFERARYGYQVVREWAERSASAVGAPDLTLEMTLSRPDPDDPALAWAAARRRQDALPPAFRPR